MFLWGQIYIKVFIKQQTPQIIGGFVIKTLFIKNEF